MVAVIALVASSSFGQFIDDTPDTPEERAPRKPDQVPTIPMNPDDSTFNLWKQIREDLREGREPGPIDIQRYPGGFGWNGIPTFFRLPVALTPEDLVAGKVEVAMLGAYTDMGTGMRGAAYGPWRFVAAGTTCPGARSRCPTCTR